MSREDNMKVYNELDKDVNLNYFIKKPPKSWESVFKKSRHELADIFNLFEGREIIPSNKEIFRPFYEVPLDKVKVVIFSDLPYKGGIADGLAFSLRDNSKETFEIKKIKMELEKQIKTFKWETNDLTCWCKEGILLINKSLTRENGINTFNDKIWLGFLKNVISAIEKTNPYCLFTLWGEKVHELSVFIKNKNNILSTGNILKKNDNRNDNFEDGNQFKLINEILHSTTGEINWDMI
jgi:uracil-DNA glycosylase